MKYYKLLYSAQELDENLFSNTCNYFIKDTNIPKLSVNSSNLCEGLLLESECFTALQTCKKNKSPGNDGISYEFYLTFWQVIKEPMLNSFNYAFEMKEMSFSQRQAIITLIDKKGKDRVYLKNWRPVSLLNNDYKIASKALAFRIKKVISELVHHDQSGFVEKRNMSFALRTILDIIDITETNQEHGLFILVDFEKAFDTVNQEFLHFILLAYNFGPFFRNWVKTLYTNITSCVVNNQISSQYFDIKRGVRQGDPLSSYLFILVVEILSINVRKNKLIEGISCKNKEIKLVQYADDTTGIFRNIKSAKSFITMVNKFSLCSGLKLNKDKTEALWIGKDKYNIAKPLSIKWPDKPLKLLGLYIGHNKKI